MSRADFTEFDLSSHMDKEEVPVTEQPRLSAEEVEWLAEAYLFCQVAKLNPEALLQSMWKLGLPQIVPVAPVTLRDKVTAFERSIAKKVLGL